jgi:hypothetical protein
VHDQHDVDVAAGAFEVVLDVAENEIDLVEIAQVIGDFLSRCLGGRGPRHPGGKKRPSRRNSRAEHIASAHDVLLARLARGLRGSGFDTSIK